MKNIVLIVTMIVMCGLMGAMRSGDPVPSVAPAATTSASVEDEECDGAAVSEDAQSCSTGGWQAQLTCCFVSGRALERWVRGPQTKCCGACFLP